MTHWTALVLRVAPAAEDDVLQAVHEAGTLGAHVDEDGGGAAQRIVAYFPEKVDLSGLRAALATLPGTVVLGEERLAEQPWVERQEASRRPLAVGARFLILAEAMVAGAAGGVQPQRPDDRFVLVVPPKRAFGTGEHETTRQCLELLESAPVAGRDVLDLGTGSGILAMAAAALGAARVVAIDDDSEAIEMARENLLLNAPAASVVELVVGRPGCLRGVFPVLVSNIYAGVLTELAAPLATLQPPAATAILSGFSPEDAAGVARAWTRHGYREVRRTRSGEWCALLLERGGA